MNDRDLAFDPGKTASDTFGNEFRNRHYSIGQIHRHRRGSTETAVLREHQWKPSGDETSRFPAEQIVVAVDMHQIAFHPPDGSRHLHKSGQIPKPPAFDGKYVEPGSGESVDRVGPASEEQDHIMTPTA
jgi:hypothetical protein